MDVASPQDFLLITKPAGEVDTYMAYLHELADKACKLTVSPSTFGWSLNLGHSHEVCMQTWQLVEVRKANFENTGCYILRASA